MKINLYFIRHGESLSNKNRDIFYPDNSNIMDKLYKLIDSVNYEPTLSANGVKQSKKLKKTLKEVNFDLYICSNLIRSIMTGIFAIDYNKEIIILPFINESQNFLQEFDKSNKMNNYDTLKLKLNYINDWLLKRKIISPTINLEYYNEETKNLLENEYNEPNINKFVNILNKIIKNKNFTKNEINICIISHGTFIRTEVYKYFYKTELDRKLINTEFLNFTYYL